MLNYVFLKQSIQADIVWAVSNGANKTIKSKKPLSKLSSHDDDVVNICVFRPLPPEVHL